MNRNNSRSALFFHFLLTLFISLTAHANNDGYDNTTWNHAPSTNLQPACHIIEEGTLVVDAGTTGSKSLYCPAGQILQNNALDVCSYTGTGVPCKMSLSSDNVIITLSCSNPHTGSIDVNHTYIPCCDVAQTTPANEICTDPHRRQIATVQMAEQIAVMEAAIQKAEQLISWNTSSSSLSSTSSTSSNTGAFITSSAQCDAVKEAQDTYVAIPDKGLLDECGSAFQAKITDLYNANSCTFGLSLND